ADAKQLARLAAMLDCIGGEHTRQEALDLGLYRQPRVLRVGRKQPVVDRNFAIAEIEFQLAGELRLCLETPAGGRRRVVSLAQILTLTCWTRFTPSPPSPPSGNSSYAPPR